MTKKLSKEQIREINKNRKPSTGFTDLDFEWAFMRARKKMIEDRKKCGCAVCKSQESNLSNQN